MFNIKWCAALVLLLCLLVPSTMFGQSIITFQKYYGSVSSNEWGYSAQQTNDGGYILQGNNESVGGIILIKVDSLGDTIWTKNYTGIGCYSVQQTNDTGYVLLGFKLIKTSPLGQTDWSKDITSVLGASSYGYCVQQTIDGGYVITGETGKNSGDLIIAKTSSIGDTIWTKCFGGSGQDRGYFVRQTSDHGYIATGFYYNSSNSNWDIYLVKTDSNGNELWQKNYGGNQDDKAYCVQQTNDGGYIIVGETESFGNGMKDLYLVKTDSSGDTMWTNTFGGTLDDYGRYVNKTTNGGFIITGATESFGQGSDYFPDLYLIKTDTLGDLLWYKTFGIANYGDGGSYVQQTTDGGFVVFGGGGLTPADMMLIKTDSSGITGIAGTTDSEGVQQTHKRSRVFPNPFISSTTLLFNTPLTNGRLKIFNILGAVVRKSDIVHHSE